MRAGIVTVAGKPNAGKSTLLNRIVGQKLSIVSPKPQSTRDRIVGIHTAGDVQMVLFDTPGLLEPRYALHRAMRSAAVRALHDADAILHLVDGAADEPAPLMAVAQLDTPPAPPVVLVINKADVLSGERRAALAAAYPDAAFIAATTGEGVDDLLGRVTALLPESPFLYPDDKIRH